MQNLSTNLADFASCRMPFYYVTRHANAACPLTAQVVLYNIYPKLNVLFVAAYYRILFASPFVDTTIYIHTVWVL